MIRSTFILLALLALGRSASAQEMGEPALHGEDFVKRFTASYGVLSEKEPPLSDVEIAILKKMAPMMRVNKEYAQNLLQSLTVAETSSSASFNYLLGNIYFENEEYFLAEEQYKTAIERFPDFQRAWTNLGVLKLRSGDTASALIAFLKAVKLGDNDAYTYGMLGYCHFKEGNYISAEVAYDRAVLAEPDNFDWLEGKAQVYFESGRYTEAVRMQDELISRRPKDISYWMAQTNAYLASGDLSRAARNIEVIRSLGSEDFQSLFLLGSLYTRLGMHEASAEAYFAASRIARDPELSFVAKAAKQLLYVGKIDEARALFDQLEEKRDALDDETLVDYYLVKADIAHQDEDLDAAISALQKAEENDPLNGTVLIKLAQLHAEQGNREKAYFVLDRAELDPDSKYNALLIRASLLIEDQRLEESQMYVSQALRIEANGNVQNLYNQLRQAIADDRD